MRWISGVAGTLLLAAVLWDAFETIVMPRRASSRVRLTRYFYRAIWGPFRAIARRVRRPGRRETYLGFFGPLSLVLLLATWAAALVMAFALLQHANGSAIRLAHEPRSLALDLYMSGTCFFTLGLGDAVPIGAMARLLAVVESGMGLGLLALVIGYFPVLYQAFSRREYAISLLDARAGSPPTAVELIRRQAGEGALEKLFYDWEQWSAELMETHLSYPILAFYRSQHTNQSWLAALTAILDSCALVMTGGRGTCVRQARLTFAMARHAVVDLAQIFPATAPDQITDRLSPEELERVRSALVDSGLQLPEEAEAGQRLAELRHLYEPYVGSLSRYLLQPLPPWRPEADRRDNWQVTARDGQAEAPEDHF